MSLGMPMAPSVLLQMVGPRVANHVLERMHDAYPDRFPLSPALASLADGGEPVVLAADPRSREQIVEDVLEAVADEIHRLLEEGVVAEAADVDTGLLLGAGWPFFLGGITKAPRPDGCVRAPVRGVVRRHARPGYRLTFRLLAMAQDDWRSAVIELPDEEGAHGFLEG